MGKLKPRNHPSRSFSLQRLLLNIAVIAGFMGIVTAFPTQVVQIILDSSLFLPALAISIAAARCSRHLKMVFAASLLGMVLGSLLTPRILTNSAKPLTWWDSYLLDLQTMPLGIAFGAATFGGVALAASRLKSRPKEQLPPTAATSSVMEKQSADSLWLGGPRKRKHRG